MKNKKGFTLVEIIVCISLIIVIGVSTTFVVIKSNKNKEQKILDKYATTFDNALEVYLSNHQEITDNLNNSVKAAAITLEVLKNDGLIDKVDGIDYKENYYLLSNAKLLDGDSTSNVECDNDVVGIEIFKKWDLSKVDDGSKVIYVCPKDSSSSGSSNNSNSTINQLQMNDGQTYTAKGANPNNWVVFEVESNPDQIAYFQDLEGNEENLWRIVSVNSENQIKLLYPNPVLSKNNTTEYKLLDHNLDGLSTSKYYKYDNETRWVIYEAYEDITSEGSKKEVLYNSIVNKSWIKPVDYYYRYYFYSDGLLELDTSQTKQLHIGMINIYEINSSIDTSNSWLFDKQMLLGYSYNSSTDNEYNVYNSGGRLDRNVAIRKSGTDRDINTVDYYPVVVLNEKVKLIKPTCSNGVKMGSKECPYTLSCTEC